MNRRQMLNKVPEVTLYFWIIKILCTTVGETAADNLNEKLSLGLTGTSAVMSVLLVGALFFQFRKRRYVPGIYRLAVVLISVVGTLITDNLGVALELSTAVFAIALAATFAVWYRSERTSPSTPSSRRAARPSTGWPSCSPSPSARPPATSSPNARAWAMASRSPSSRQRSPW
jgi:uncharacterized membrane-anchored protein